MALICRFHWPDLAGVSTAFHGCRTLLGRALGRTSVARRSPPVWGRSGVVRRRNELRSTDVFVASYPRSGNTWLRMLLADVILQLRATETDTTLPIPVDQIIPCLDRGDQLTANPRVDLPFRLIKTHSPYVPLIRKAIVIFRLPADSLCSYYHYRRHFTSVSVKTDKNIDAFCRRHVEVWKEHLQSYVKAVEQNDASLFLTAYEQLHDEPAAVLGRVFRFLGFDPDASLCQRAVEHHTFAKHRHHKTLGEVSRNFFRQGRIDSGRDELSTATVRWVNRSAMELYRRASALALRPVPRGKSLVAPR